MTEKKVNILFDIEYIDTISNEISLEDLSRFNKIKRLLDYIKSKNLITFDEWYNALLLTRKRLNLPYVK